MTAALNIQSWYSKRLGIRQTLIYTLFLSILLVSVPRTTGDAANNITAALGGKEPVVVTYERVQGAYVVYYRSFDVDRGCSWCYSVVREHKGDIDLEISGTGSLSGFAMLVDAYSDPGGSAAGLTFEDTRQSLASNVVFNFSVVGDAMVGTYKVSLSVFQDSPPFTVYERFDVFFPVAADGDEDLPLPRVILGAGETPSQADQGQLFSVGVSFANIGTAPSLGQFQGDGVQLYVEGGEFVTVDNVVGFTGYSGYDYNNSQRRGVGGANVLELYDIDGLAPSSASDTAKVSIKITGTPGSSLALKYSAWLSDDEKVYDTWTRSVENVLVRISGGGTPLWPFNNEWSLTKKFDDSAAMSQAALSVYTTPEFPSSMEFVLGIGVIIVLIVYRRSTSHKLGQAAKSALKSATHSS